VEVDSTLSKLNSPELKAVNAELLADPNNAALYYKRGQIYFKNNDMEAAKNDAVRAVKIDSLKPEYFILLSDVYFASNQTRFSKEVLERCVRANPGSIEANLKLAELYFYVQKHKESIQYIDNALRINENTAKGYFLKGMNFKEMGDTALAISSFQTTVEQDNEYLDAYLELGTLLTLKKNALALEYLKTALKMKPGNSDVMYEIGMYYQQAKNYPAAMESYKALLSKDPKYKKAYYNMGAIDLYANKDYKQAIKHFTNAINADPNYADAYFARGVCYEELKDRTNAIADYQMAIQLDPQHSFAIENLNALEKK
jgi:tetratricopeptide (TPR) repeat protein